jgi:uncharacterized protein (DUF1684 family)
MSELDEYRKQKDDFFQHDVQSPLEAHQRADFHGLKYYPENPKLRIITPLGVYEDQQPVTMITSTGSAREYVKYGCFTFHVNEETATLQVYQSADDGSLFLPFIDATAPEETYGAGRYVEVEALGDDKFLIDFYYAYNPYCAYNENWACPLPPRENHLKVRIEAGEKKYYEDH